MSNIQLVEFALAVKRGLISSQINDPHEELAIQLLDDIPLAERNSIRKQAEELLSDHDNSLANSVSSLDLAQDLTKKILALDSSNSNEPRTSDREKPKWDEEVTRSYDNNLPTIGSGRYQIIRQCGEGGLGVVFTARDQQLNRIVALKTLHPHLVNSKKAVERFEAEAEFTGELQHPAIAPVYSLDVGTDGTPFYTMRYIEGESLSARLKRDGVKRQNFSDASFRQLLLTFNQVTRAVDFAHSLGIIHRDIKPANIMLGDYGETFLVDWGLAKTFQTQDTSTDAANGDEQTIELQQKSDQHQRREFTRSGDIVGTPAYMSPEQARGESNISGATDVYGLGATLFTLLTGQSAFAKKDPDKVISLLIAGQISGPIDINQDVPVELNAICKKAMAANVNERYTTAKDLRSDIECWLADEPTSVAPNSVLTRIRRQVRKRFALVASIVAGALICLVLVASGLVVSSNQNRKLRDLNDQLVLAEQSSTKSRKLAYDNFQHAQDIVGEFLIEVAEAPALKNGRTESQELRRDLLEKAQKYYETFIAEADISDDTRLHLIDAQLKLATIMEEFGEFKRCEEIARNGLRFLDEVPTTELAKVERADTTAFFLRLLGVSQHQLGKYDQAIESMELAVKTRQEVVDEGLADSLFKRNLARNKSNLALVLMDRGEYERADALETESAKIIEAVANKDVHIVADQIDYLSNKLQAAQIKDDLGQTAEAVALLHEGLQRAKNLHASQPEKHQFLDYCANLAQDLSVILNRKRKVADAIAYTSYAIECRTKIIQMGITSFDNSLYLGSAYRQLAEMQMDSRDPKNAERNINLAIETIQALLVNDNDNVEARDRLAGSLKTRADMYRWKNEVEKSASDYDRARRLLQEIVDDGKASMLHRHAVARVLNNHANLHILMKQDELAEEKLKQAVEIIAELESIPAPTVNVLRDFLIIHSGLGKLLSRTKATSEGELILKRNIPVAKRLYDRTKDVDDGHTWAWSINTLAATKNNRTRAKDKIQTACELFKQSKAAWESLPIEYKKTDDFAYGFGGTLVNGSVAFRNIKDFATCEQWLTEAEKLMGEKARSANPHRLVERYHAFGQKALASVLIVRAQGSLGESATKEKLKEGLDRATRANKLVGGGSVEALKLCAEINLKLDDKQAAIESLNAALEFADITEKVELQNQIRSLLGED